jgi:hypothetical protein
LEFVKMKKILLIVLAIVPSIAFAGAQMWCLNGTNTCSYGTPSLSRLNQEDRAASLYKMFISKYNEAVTDGTFNAVTANQLIVLAKEYLTSIEPEIPTQPEIEPPVVEPPMGTYTFCANEWTWCDLPAGKVAKVRYGLNEFNYIENMSGRFNCTNDVFGDPEPSASKQCSYLVTGDISEPPVVEPPVVEPPVVEPPVVEPPVVEPPLPPTGQNNMPFIDLTKVPTFMAGSTEILIRETSTGEEQVGNSQFANGGQFREPCKPSHMNNDDFILYPNQQSAAHHHTYFGNTSARYDSDPYTLASTGSSTCSGGMANGSAYWIPTMVDTATNTPIKPKDVLAYYKTSNSDKVVVPPTGLRMIANLAGVNDNPNTPDLEPWRSNKRFMCNQGQNQNYNHLPICEQGSTLDYEIYFPICWDGVNLDSPDHKSHVVYQKDHNYACPATHPKILPSIVFVVHYDVTTPNGTRDWKLASDNYIGGPGGYSAHGDWVNGWNQSVLETIVNNCLRAARDCHAELLGNGNPSQRLFIRNPAEPWTMSYETVPLR